MAGIEFVGLNPAFTITITTYRIPLPGAVGEVVGRWLAQGTTKELWPGETLGVSRFPPSRS
jgi:hypothetical protein